ncbi:MAG: PaaI family thioesterase [Mycobacterium sp.]
MTTGDAGQLVDMINAAMERTIPTAHRMGVRVVEAERGYAAATVPVEGNGNHFGVVYAGVEFTVAEILGGIIALSTFDSAKYFPLVKNVDIAFAGMARSQLRAEARHRRHYPWSLPASRAPRLATGASFLRPAASRAQAQRRR